MKLIIKNPDGTQNTVDVGQDALKLAAKPGATYRVVDEKTGKTSVTTIIKRSHDDLVIDDGTPGHATVQIEGFFSECAPNDRCYTVLDTPPSIAASAGEVIITQDSTQLASLGAGYSGGMGSGQELAFAHMPTGAVAHEGGIGMLGWIGAGLAVAAAAAGGGGGGGGSPASSTTLPDTKAGPLTVKGTVAAGPMATGTVDVYVYDKDGNLLGHGLVKSDKGDYEIVIADKGNYTGPLLLVAKDADGSAADNYRDEATGRWTNLGASMAAVGTATSDTAVINVTPLTQLAAMKMGVDVNAAGATLKPPADVAFITMMNKAISDFFGVKDILGAVVTINEDGFRSADADAARYGVALARLSEMDMQTGSWAATLQWLLDSTSMSGTTLTSSVASLFTVDTERTIPRELDAAAAKAAADAAYHSAINLGNVASARVVVALPVNSVAGDLVHLTLTGPNGTLTTDVHVVTAEELLQGYASVGVTSAMLASLGSGTVVPSVMVTDAQGNNASATYTAASFSSDVVAPDPALALPAGGHAAIGAASTTVTVAVSYAGIAAGDTVQLQLGGGALGVAHVVTAAEAAAGSVSISFDKAALGADGSKAVTAVVTDVAGNAGTTTSALTLVLDTSAPTPSLALAAGQSAVVNASNNTVQLDVGVAGLAAGDTVQLQLGGNALGTPHVVTAAEVAAGHATIAVNKSDLGADGAKTLQATTTDAAGNAGTSSTLALTLDTSAPAPSLALAAGQNAFVNAAQSTVGLHIAYAGIAAGDVVQLQLAGSNIGTPYTVTSADANAGSITVQVNKSDLGSDGVKAITAVATDAAGNAGTSTALSLTLDTQAAVPALTIKAGQDALLNAADTGIDLELRYSGLTAGDRVQLSASGASLGSLYTVTATDVANGVVSFNISKTSLGSDGLKNLAATVTDAAGNAGSSPAVLVTLDTAAPAPSLAIALGEDQYLNASESSVNLQVSYAGLTAGDTVQLKLAGSNIGTPYTVTNADVTAGHATINVAKSDLGADGSKSISVVATDAAGNAGSSSPLGLVVDSVAAVPTLAIASGEDRYLNAVETAVHLDVGFAGMAAGNVIQLRMNGSDFGSPYIVTGADVTAGHATLTVNKSDLGGNGSSLAAVVASGAAGNAGSSNAIALIVDTDIPAPTLSIAPGSDAFLNAAETTLPLQLSYAGLAAGDVIQLQLGGVNLGSTYTVTSADVTAGHATLSVAKSGLGVDGVKSLTAIATDLAGNAGTSSALSVTLDTTAPTPTLAIQGGENALLNASESQLHLVLSDASLAAGDVVQLTLAGASFGSPYTVTSADVTAGHVTLTVASSSLGADGVKNLAATLTDAAGNTGSTSNIAVTLDTAAPAPVLALQAGEDSFLNASESTAHVVMSYAGLAAGDVLQLQLGGSSLGAPYTVTGADVTAGHVTFAVARGSLGADGLKNLSVAATDAAGNTGTSSPLGITLDTSAPAPALGIAVGQDNILNVTENHIDLTVAYAGLAAGDVIQLQLGGSNLGSTYTVTSADVTAGHATITVGKSALGADGVKSLTAIATDLAGNAGTSSALPVTLDSVSAVPSLSIVSGEDALLGGAETAVHLQAGFTGMTAGDTLQLKLAGSNLGTAYTITSGDVTAGHATLTVNRVDLGADGTKSLTVSGSGTAANAGASNAVNVLVDTTAPVPTLAVAAGQDNLIGAAESQVSIEASYSGLAAGDVIQLQLGGVNLGSPYTVTSADVTAGHATFSVTRASLGADGAKSLTAVATDLAGNTGTGAALGLVVDTVAPVPSLVVKAGEDAIVNALENGVDVQVGYAGMAAGEHIQLQLGGSNVGSVYTITSADVTAGSATILVSKGSLGSDGSKSLTANVTDAAGNTGSSSALALLLDTTAPSVQFSNHTGSLITGAGAGLIGSGKPGVSLVDASSIVTDGGPVAVGKVTLALSGFADGSHESLSIGNATLNADGSGAPATVTAGGFTWAVAYASGHYTFTATSNGGSAGASDVAALMQASYNDTASTTTDGQRSLGYTLTDVHGNDGNTVTSSVLVSTVPPSITSAITALSNDTGVVGDFITTVAAQSVSGSYSGTLHSGDKIQVSLDNTTWIDATITSASTWIANGVTLQSGSHNLYLRAVDLAGNASTPTTQAYTLESATIATTAAITGAVDDVALAGSSVGAIAHGSSTDDVTPTLNGTLTSTLASGQVVAIYDGSTRLGEANVTGTSWSFTTSTLPTGKNSLTAMVEHPASGAHSANSNTFDIYEQTLSLSAADDVGSTQGLIPLNGATDDALPHLSGMLGTPLMGSGEVIAIYDGSTRVGTASVSGTSWSFDFGVPLPDGQHTFRAVLQDVNDTSWTLGRVVSDAQVITVDTSSVPPTQSASITSVVDDAATHGSSVGTLASNTSTDDRTLSLSGTISSALLAGQVLAVYDTVNGTATKIGTATVVSTGWTFTTPSLADGSHSLVAVVENAANGSKGTPSSAFVVQEQTITLASMEDNVGIDVGTILNAGLTDDATPTLRGTLANATLGSNEVVAVYDNTTKIGTATVTGTQWIFTPSTPLADGLHSLWATVQDGSTGTATNGRAVSDPMTLTVLTALSTPAQAVTISTASESTATNGSLTGSFATGTSTDGTTPALTGTINSTLNVAEVLAVYDGATRLGYATVSGTSWTYTTPTLALGSHSLTARVENIISGAAGSSSNTFVVIEQSIAATALVDDVGATQGNIAAGGVTDDNRPAFSGTLGSATLGSGEVVAVYDGSTRLGNATVSGSTWSYTPAALTDGSHSLRAVIQDNSTGTSSNARASTGTTSFTVNTSNLPPTQTSSITGVAEYTATQGSVTGNFSSNTSTDGRTPTLTGTLSASLTSGQAVAVYDGATRLGYAAVTGTTWTYTTASLAVGSHSLTTVVENQASGSQGTASSAFQLIEQSITVDSLLGIIGAVQVLVGGVLGVVLGTSPTFTGSLGTATLGTNEVVAVYDGATKLGNATLNGTAWGFTPTSPLSTGFHNLVVMIQDAGTINANAGRVVAPALGFNVDVSLLVPTQTASIDWAIESTATNGSVTGSFTSGTSTDGTTPSIGGALSSALTGAQVLAVYDGSTKLGNATVTGQSWSYTTPTLASGQHTLTVQVENPSTGSHGTASSGFVIVEQSLSAMTVFDDVGTIQGNVALHGVTDDKRPTLSGTLGSATLGHDVLGVVSETVAIYDTVNGVTSKIGDATVSGTSWSFTPGILAPLADGTHSFTAVIQPLLSLTSAGRVVSPAFDVTIDSSSTPLQVALITTVTDGTSAGGSASGLVIGGGTLDDTTPVVSGTLSSAISGAQALAIYDTVNSVKTRIGYATINPGNPLQWSFEPGTALVDGTHTLTARVENTATGSQGTESLGYLLTERTVTLHVTDNVGALQGDVLGYASAVTDDTTLLLSGTIGSALALSNLGVALERVRVYDNGSFVANATVTGTDWSYNLTGLTNGSHHDISVRITDLTGLVYTVATAGSFNVAASDITPASDSSYTSSGSVAKFTLGGSANTLDLTKVSGASQPEIDVVVAGNGNTVKLALADVLQGGTNLFNTGSGWSGVTGTGKHQMVIDGSAGSASTVNVTDGTWTSQGTTTHNGHTYTVYEDSTHLAQLLIDSQLSRAGTVGP